MECCANYDRIFDQKQAKKDLKRYRKKGLQKSSQRIVDFLQEKISGLTVLEVGSGKTPDELKDIVCPETKGQ